MRNWNWNLKLKSHICWRQLYIVQPWRNYENLPETVFTEDFSTCPMSWGAITIEYYLAFSMLHICAGCCNLYYIKQYFFSSCHFCDWRRESPNASMFKRFFFPQEQNTLLTNKFLFLSTPNEVKWHYYLVVLI